MICCCDHLKYRIANLVVWLKVGNSIFDLLCGPIIKTVCGAPLLLNLSRMR
jgi:hypothetical protein